VKIAYLDGPRLRRVLLAAHRCLASRRAELDRINVFPVADGDTGTNLALTFREVADAVRPLETASVSEVAGVAAEAGVVGARGNSGMLLAHMLMGFARALDERIRVGTGEIAEALDEAASALADALEEPVEGTIVTVARETAAAALRSASEDDLYDWLREIRSASRRSLGETSERLPALREAGVVDAGAKGFVTILEAALCYVEGRPLASGDEASGGIGGDREAASDRESAPSASPSEGRYCTQIALRGDDLPPEGALRSRLRERGTSLVVARVGEVAKVHVHTDDPGAVERELAAVGEVASRRVEDTRAPRLGRATAVVTDSSCDLPPEWARENGVEVVPLQLVHAGRTYRDGVEVDPDQLLEMLDDPEAPPPTTSQAPPGDFLAAYRDVLAAGAEEVLGVFLSAALSGTCESAAAAARQVEEADPRVVDSRTGSMGLGMMVMRAVELLDEGMGTDEVAAELERLRRRSGLFFTVRDLEGLLRSGRVGRARAWFGDLLGLRPVLALDDEGRVVPHARVRGRDGARDAMVSALDEALAGAERYRLAVVHAGVPDFAADLRRRLRRRYRPLDVHVRPLTAVVTAHLGPGAWGICYQVEDGPATNQHRDEPEEEAAHDGRTGR
jgi:DegV family protein with EDD domain